MPELPEVETIRRELEKEVVGRKVKSVEVDGKKSIKRQTPEEFSNGLVGAKITGSQRKGKYLLMPLDNGQVLIVHLRMSGQLRRATPKDEVEKHTHVTITFTQGGQLRFIDPRTFGEMFLATPDEISSEIEELSNLGVDPVEAAHRDLDLAAKVGGGLLGHDRDRAADGVAPEQIALRTLEDLDPVNIEQVLVSANRSRQIDAVQIDTHARIEIECEIVLADAANIGGQHSRRSRERRPRVKRDVGREIAYSRHIGDAFGFERRGSEGGDRYRNLLDVLGSLLCSNHDLGDAARILGLGSGVSLLGLRCRR